jgi:hypothetical protein
MTAAMVHNLPTVTFSTALQNCFRSYSVLTSVLWIMVAMFTLVFWRQMAMSLSSLSLLFLLLVA